MKKLFTITLSFIISCSFAQWEWQNPLPQGNSIEALSFIDNNKGWAVGWGTILHTNDGGQTWNTKESRFGDGYYDKMLRDVCFTDAMNGWIVGGMPGFIFHTEDGGQTWFPSSDDGTKLPSAKTNVFFIDQQTGWVLGWSAYENSVHILRTTDGGTTWDRYNVCDITSPYNGGIYFVNNTKGWVVWGSKVMHTIDGGITWEEQFEDYQINLNDIHFYDSDYGWAVGGETVLITEDGGDTWMSSTDSVVLNKNFNTVSFTSKSIGWCGGFYHTDMGNIYNGVIIKTNDGGLTWENQLDYHFTTPILDLTCTTDTDAFAVGENGFMLKAIYQGNSWTKISSKFTNCGFLDVFFIDNQNGWVAGGSGSPGVMPTPNIFCTNDGGITWIAQIVHHEGSGYNYKLFFTDPNHGWSLGVSNIYSGTHQLICTVNGGENWQVQSTEDIANDIYFINNNVGWRIGDFGTVQKTEDGGWNWSDQQSGTERSLKSVIFIDEDIGWVAGDSVVLKTENGGNTWQEQSVLQSSWNQIFFFDDLHGWIVSPGWGGNSGGFSLKTNDGGISWEEINGNFLEVYFVDPENGWGRSVIYPFGGAASPPAYNMWTTNDGGLTWEIQPTPTLIEGGFCFVDANNGWAVSSDGTILHTNNGGASGIFESHFQNSSFIANLFPNPFTTSTTLSYELNQPEKVTLTIYDYLGKQVYQTQENQPQGKQELIWDAERYAEGIYYYRLQVGDDIANGKMVKVR